MLTRKDLLERVKAYLYFHAIDIITPEDWLRRAEDGNEVYIATLAMKRPNQRKVSLEDKTEVIEALKHKEVQ
jgi:hypothetical protein